MQIEALVTKTPGVTKDMTIDSCLAFAGDTDIELLHLIDETRRYAGSFKVTDLLRIAKSIASDVVLSDIALRFSILPTVTASILLSEVKFANDTAQQINQFVVVDENGCYCGELGFCEVMKWQLERLQEQVAWFNAIQEYQQCGIAVVD